MTEIQSPQPEDMEELDLGAVPLTIVNSTIFEGEQRLRELMSKQVRLGLRTEEAAQEELEGASSQLIPGITVQHIRINSLLADVEARIGVNIKGISTMGNIGGFTGIYINDNAKIDDQDQTSILGVSNDGQAVSGFSKSRSVKSQNEVQSSGAAPLENEFATQIDLDSSKMATEITENGDSIRSPEAWVKMLNQEVREQIQSACGKFLLTPKETETLLALMISFTLLTTPGAVEETSPLYLYMLIMAAINFCKMAFTMIEKAVPFKTASLYFPSMTSPFLGIQADRYALLLAASSKIEIFTVLDEPYDENSGATDGI